MEKVRDLGHGGSGGGGWDAARRDGGGDRFGGNFRADYEQYLRAMLLVCSNFVHPKKIVLVSGLEAQIRAKGEIDIY